MSTSIPILQNRDAQAPVARWRGRLISRAQFLAHVRAVAAQLPERRYLINLCEDRYLFLVAFAAVMARGFTTLLPPTRVPAVVADVAGDFEPCLCVVEQPSAELALQQFVMPDLTAVQPADQTVPEVPAEQPVAVVFTSGSTGKPCPHWKYWGDLVHGTLLAQRRFGIEPGCEIIATVPPQHMYGLETSILLPLVAGAIANAGRPFFAEDIRRSLEQAQQARILVTTPVHLRTCVGAGLQWQAPNFVISATAPLSFELAQQAEQILQAPVLEIFGSTETGSIASRRTISGGQWQLYDGLRMDAVGTTASVSGGHLRSAVPLNDHVRLHDPSTFELLGRPTDLINIAGKRASLMDLNRKLLQIDGVDDGVFVPHEAENGKVARLTALVVAPGMDKAALLAALAAHIDPAFMPRPLHLVDRLPRAETGKLPRAALLPLMQRLGRDS